MTDTDTKEQDVLTLKWGGLKAWQMLSKKGEAAFEAYLNAGKLSMSGMANRQTDKQKLALCALIDAVNTSHIYNDWTGKDMTKAEAKEYVMESGR